MDRDDAIEGGVDPRFDDAADPIDQAAVPRAVARLAPGAHAVPGNGDELPIKPAHGGQETSAQQVAAIRGHEGGQAEIHTDPVGAWQVGSTALGESLGHVRHQPDAEAGARGIWHHLQHIAPLALPAPPMGVGVQRDGECRLADQPEAGPEIAVAGAGGRRHLHGTDVEHRGDTPGIGPPVPAQHRAHDTARQAPDLGRDWRCLALHDNLLPTEPSLPAVDRVQRVLNLAGQAGARDGISELVLPVGQEAAQHGRDLRPGHLRGRCPAIGVEGADIAVLAAKCPGLEEGPPLSRGNRRGASTVTAGECENAHNLPGVS